MKNLAFLVVILILLLLAVGLQLEIDKRENKIRVLKEVIYLYENPNRKEIRKDIQKKGWEL